MNFCCSVGNFAVNLVPALFTPEELAGRNCSGKKGKMPLDNVKLQKVKGYVLKLYPSQASQRETQWKTSPLMNTSGGTRRVTVLLSMRCSFLGCF